MAEMESVVVEVRRLHLNRQVVNAEAVMQFHAQLLQELRLRNSFQVNHVRAQGLATGSDSPDVQVVNVLHAIRL